MTILSPSDLQLIRTQPQQSQLFLSLYQPETVFSAQLNNVPSDPGNRTIQWTNLVTGSLAGVLDNFAMMVGSTPGGNEYGVVRVRGTFTSGSAQGFTLAENSHINWVSGSYLTVLNWVDVEAIYPRIVQTTAGTISATFFKDFDIPYTNQNSIYGSFVCMGPHRASFRDPASGQTQLYWSSSGTINLKGEGLNYQWEFEGGTPTGSTLQDPGYITYSQPGHFRTRLVVTATGTGAQDIGYRFVSIYDHPEAGPNRPILEWEIQDLNGSRREGGYTGRIKIWERVGPEFVRDGQLVVMFSDDYYGNTRKNLGGNAENCSGIFWVGYVSKGTIIYDYKEGTVEFYVQSITQLMREREGFSVSCQDDGKPDTWFKLFAMSVLKSMYHYLRWHSTAAQVTDFQYTGDDRQVQYFDSNRESMYDAIAKYLKSGLKGELVADRQGKMWAEISPDATFNARSAFPLNMSIGPTDYGSSPKTNSVAISSKSARVSNGPQITERYFSEISYVEYGGIAYNRADGSSSAFLAGGPGQTPAYKGKIDHMEGMILNSQAQLNQIVGASYAYQNSHYPEIAFPLVGAYKNIDIAPLEMIQMNVDASLTPRATALVNEPCHVMSQEWRYYSREKSIIHTLHLAQLVDGFPGSTILIATTPAQSPLSGQGFQVPGINLPPIPTFIGGGGGGTPNMDFAYCAANDSVVVDQNTQNIPIFSTTLTVDGCIVTFGPLTAGMYVFGVNGQIQNPANSNFYAEIFQVPGFGSTFTPLLASVAPLEVGAKLNAPFTAVYHAATVSMGRMGNGTYVKCTISDGANTGFAFNTWIYAWAIRIST